MTISPGMMNAAPPTRAPARPRSRQAQKMASWVEAGPGIRLQTAMASSNSRASSQPLPLDAQLTQQPDVRGRPAEADTADPAPLPQHRRQGNRRYIRGTAALRRQGVFPWLAHRGRTA